MTITRPVREIMAAPKAYGAVLINVPQQWIIVGVIVLCGTWHRVGRNIYAPQGSQLAATENRSVIMPAL
jgi:hypothetical protein